METFKGNFDEFINSNLTHILKILWLQPEDDMIDFINKNKSDLGRNAFRIKFRCLTLFDMVCICCHEIEEMEFSISKSEMLNRLLKNMYLGACPHVSAVMKDKNLHVDSTFLNSWLSHDEKTITSDVDLIKQSNKNFTDAGFYIAQLYRMPGHHTEWPYFGYKFPSCGTTLLHMAIGLRKFSVVKYLVSIGFNKDLNQNVSKQKPFKHNIYLNADQKTLFFWFSVYHLGIRFGCTELLSLRLENDLCLETFYGCDGPYWRGIVTNYAVEKGDVEALMKLLCMSKTTFPQKPWVKPKLMSYALSYAYYKVKKEMVSFLIKEGAFLDDVKEDFLPKDDSMMGEVYCECHSSHILGDHKSVSMAIQKVVEADDMQIFKSMISCKGFKDYIEDGLYHCVVQGKVDKAKVMLTTFHKEWQKLKRKKVKQRFFNHLMSIAVLHNHFGVLQTLVKAEIKESFEKNKRCYSAKDWAELLHFQECFDLLQKQKYPSHFKECTNTNPLLQILRIKLSSSKRQYLIQRLVQCGSNVNFKDSSGVTPVSRALEHHDYPSVHALLLSGADFFLATSPPTNQISTILLKELFFCNVDICGHLLELCCMDSTQGEHIPFILQCVHTVNETDKDRLRNSLPIALLTKYEKEISEFFEEVPSLFKLSRNAVRKACGPKVHMLIQQHSLPLSFRHALLLVPEFEMIHGYNQKWILSPAWPNGK